jgi:hypothetical protein
MSDAKSYAGSCHCGKVTYQVAIDLGHVITCNCSMCSRTGSIMAFVQPSRFQLQTGERDLHDYQFNTKNIHHLFCSNCGVRSFARGADPKGNEMIMINVRCLAGVELDSLKPTAYDGRSV